MAALEAQASPPDATSPPRRSPPDADLPDAPPPPTPPRQAGGEPEEEEAQAATRPTTALSTDLVVVASQPRADAAKYVPPRPASHAADPSGGGGWYSWNGRRSDRPAQRSRPAPPPPRQREPEMLPPPPPPRQREPKAQPPPAPVPAPAPPPPPPAPPSPPTAAPARTTRSADDDVVPTILSRKRRAAAMQRTALVARFTAAGLCLAALAVLAADTRKGWALDSYSRYSQFRYSEAVNVIGFLYSLFQFIALADLIRKNKHLVPRPKRDCFDFAMDQALAYLLLSSSSSATARVGDLIDNWGSDPFPNMANSSIAISFLAFIVFAICSLISAYNLFRRDM